MAEEYINRASEKNEGSITEKLRHDFSRTESCILGALSKLGEFFLNPRVRICSVAVHETSRNNNLEKREPTGDLSLNDPCPEVRGVLCLSHQ